MRTLKAFLADCRGVVTIEIGLIAGLIAVAVLATASALAGSLSNLIQTISGQLAPTS